MKPMTILIQPELLERAKRVADRRTLEEGRRVTVSEMIRLCLLTEVAAWERQFRPSGEELAAMPLPAGWLGDEGATGEDEGATGDPPIDL